MCTILEQIYALSLGSKAKYLIFFICSSELFFADTVLKICFILFYCKQMVTYIQGQAVKN